MRKGLWVAFGLMLSSPVLAEGGLIGGVNVPPDIPEWSKARIPEAVADSAFKGPEVAGLGHLSPFGIELHMPSLEMAVGDGATVGRHQTILKVKARFKATGVAADSLCMRATKERPCHAQALIPMGAKAFKTAIARPGEKQPVEVWCGYMYLNRSGCVYESSKGNYAFGSSHPGYNPLVPWLRDEYTQYHPGILTRAEGPMKVTEQRVDLGSDLSVVVLFEDFDAKEVDLRVIVYSFGQFGEFSAPKLPRAADGSVSLIIDGKTLTLRPVAGDKQKARVEIRP